MMFDYVRVPCPTCNADLETQTRAGECCLMTYGPSDLPREVAHALDGESVYCEACHREWTIQVVTRTTYDIAAVDPGTRSDRDG